MIVNIQFLYPFVPLTFNHCKKETQKSNESDFIQCQHEKLKLPKEETEIDYFKKLNHQY